MTDHFLSSRCVISVFHVNLPRIFNKLLYEEISTYLCGTGLYGPRTCHSTGCRHEENHRDRADR